MNAAGSHFSGMSSKGWRLGRKPIDTLAFCSACAEQNFSEQLVLRSTFREYLDNVVLRSGSICKQLLCALNRFAWMSPMHGGDIDKIIFVALKVVSY